MKRCTKCNDLKAGKHFSNQSRSKDGLQSKCKDCDSKYYSANRQHKLEYQTKWSKDNPSKAAKYSKTWRQNHPDTHALRTSEWKKNNPDKNAAKEARRRAKKLNATPKWLTVDQNKEIESYYILAKEIQWLSIDKLEVDHIIPLQGKIVSGLHVPWNLQILTKTDNAKKLNRLGV